MRLAMNPIVVQKYGGSSVADLEKIRRVAKRIVDTVKSGKRVVAVVSAMAGTTDDLLDRAETLSKAPNPRELDMLLTVGERISTALLAIAIHDCGIPATSFTGSQSGIITNTRHNRARIIEVRPYRLLDELDAGNVVVVAGYQGVSYAREITTLGRGGTDTTAVALAAALDAEYCEICSDVDGVYTADPNVVMDAKRLDALSHEEMLALARSGARVLHQDCVEYASTHGVAIFAKATFGPRDDKGTVIRLNHARPKNTFTAIAHRERVGEIRLSDDKELNPLLDRMSTLGVTVDAMYSGVSDSAIELMFALEDTHQFDTLAQAITQDFSQAVRLVDSQGTVTLVGNGLGEDPQFLKRLLDSAKDVLGQRPQIRLGPLTMTLKAPRAHITTLVKSLHREFIEK
jgi:aspartate kinase